MDQSLAYDEGMKLDAQWRMNPIWCCSPNERERERDGCFAMVGDDLEI